MFFLIIFLVVILAYHLKYCKSEASKNITYNIIFALLFVIFGLEYGCSVDYFGYVGSYHYANGINSQYVQPFMTLRPLEPIFRFLNVLFSPLGFFYLKIVIAIFNLYVLRKLVCRLIPIQWTWLFFIEFLLLCNYGLLLVNSIRQALAVFVVLLGVLYMWKHRVKHLSFIKQIKRKENWILFLCVVIAGNIHTSAYFAILYYPLIIFLPKKINLLYTILIAALFLASFVVSLDTLLLGAFIEQNAAGFEQYLEELGKTNEFSLIYYLFDFIFVMLLCYYYNMFSDIYRLLACAAIVALIGSHFMSDTMGRILLPFSVFVPFMYAILASYIPKPLRTIYLFVLFVFTARWFSNTILADDSYYSVWASMHTIFTAPQWL